MGELQIDLRMKKIAAIVLFTSNFLLLSSVFGQDFNPPEPKPQSDKKKFPDWSKVYTGGGLGLQFGTVTLINVAPDIGYKITERYSAGVGLRYMYLQIPGYKIDIYGASIFNRFIVTDFFFLHGEYEVLNGPWDYRFPGHRFNLNNVWVGGGLRQGGGGTSFNVMALWNLNDEGYLPNPQIRMGISIGL
jgi:hypothetical protein